ncbi:MAG: hypothetical protein Q4E70_00060 [Candidatus Saccharibacteria bacterium]|nr:hypothetical protein [Candidatus Saccharibacteria bacterium]
MSALSLVPVSGRALATGDSIEDCFEADDPFYSLDDPYRSAHILLAFKATCSMKLHYMDISFSGTEDVKGLDTYYATVWHDQISSFSIHDDEELHIKWNDDEDDPDTVDGRPYIDVEPDEYLFGYWYTPQADTTVFKHSMPITINEVHYDTGEGVKTAKNIVLNPTITIAPDESKDVLMISGIEKQDVTYTDHPVVLNGDLTIEDNTDGITVDDLNDKYYEEDGTTEISQPTNPGSYVAEYYYENDNYRASLKVPFTIKDYITVSTDIQGGHGEVSAPLYVDMGGSLHVDIMPSDGYEVLRVEHNGTDVTELLNEDNSLDIEAVTGNAEIAVVFRPFYEVTEGDGSEYTLGSGEDLTFKIDKDPASYTAGIVTVSIDGAYIDVEEDCTIDPDSQTVTLKNATLEALNLGEHKLEIFFFDTDVNGIARASFTVVEAEEEVPAVPDTSGFTEKSDTKGAVVNYMIILPVMIIAAIAILKKLLTSKR